MKKFIVLLVLGLLFFSKVNVEEKISELDKLFIQLKNAKDSSSSLIIRNKILKI